MTYDIARTAAEIDDVLNAASEAQEEGTRWPAMSYEQGVEAAILWVTGVFSESPMDE